LRADSFHPLPAHRAFLVQVHAEADPARGRLAGRAEHVVSGQAMHFASIDELLAFIAGLLTDERRAVMGTWKRAYPTAKIAALNTALSRGFGTTLTDKDISDTIQRSSNYQDFAKKLIEMHSVAADLESLVALCEKELG
jgi:hypothetical protein